MVTREQRLFETRNDLEQEARQEMVDLLNAQLADTFDLFSQMKHAHWNVKGPQFSELHELFDTIAAGLLPHIDAIAERATALGGPALGTVRMAAESTRLDPYPPEVFGSMSTVTVAAERMAQAARNTREAAARAEELEDMASSDLLIEAVRDMDKWLWFLEAHLQD